MRRLTISVVISFILITGSAAAFETPDLDQDQKDQVKDYVNNNLESVPGPLKESFADKDINIEIGDTTYGFRFDGGNLSEIWNGGYADPNAVITVTDKAADKIVESDEPYKTALEMKSQNEITIDRNPDPKKRDEATGENVSTSENKGPVDSVTSAVSSVSEGMVNTVFNTAAGIGAKVMDVF